MLSPTAIGIVDLDDNAEVVPNTGQFFNVNGYIVGGFFGENQRNNLYRKYSVAATEYDSSGLYLAAAWDNGTEVTVTVDAKGNVHWSRDGESVGPVEFEEAAAHTRGSSRFAFVIDARLCKGVRFSVVSD